MSTEDFFHPLSSGSKATIFNSNLIYTWVFNRYTNFAILYFWGIRAYIQDRYQNQK